MAPGVSSCHYREVPPSISFSGSGFMATYQLGVAQSFLNHAPWILHTSPCVLGASAGSLVAAAVVCEMSLVMIRDEMLNFAKHMKAFTFGPFNPSINIFHWLEFILDKHLPSNAHQLATGRLAVAMTRMTDSKLTIMTEFQSKEDVRQALLCSCFVPGYCGMMPPSIKGVHYVDGGFSSMQPVLPVSCTQILTVSPFSGDMDICPSDNPCMLDMVVNGTILKGNMANSFRIFNALYPMALETLEQAYYSGYKDAIDFLLSNDLVPCWKINEMSQRPSDCNQTKIIENDTEEEEEVKGETEITTQTSFIDERSWQRRESTANTPTEEPPLQFEMVQNVMVANVVTYLTVFGLPETVLSHLLLPITLIVYIVLQCKNRLMLMFKPVPEMLFWAWHGLRHHTSFVIDIFLCSLKKNMMDRFMPLLVLLELLRIQMRYEAPQEQRHATSFQKFPSSAHSEDIKPGNLHRRHFAPSQDHKKTNV